ncbi:glycosyltransferase [Patescibacteria group bacterium]
MKKKNILILYSKMGKGHLSASVATKNALEKLYSDKVNVKVIDFWKLAMKSMHKTSEKAYDGSVKYMPYMYKAFFDFYDTKWQVKLLNKLYYPALSTALKKLLKETEPDTIISTYPIWDYTIAKIWKKKHPNKKFINIITDSITLHSIWTTADADIRIVPNEDTAKVLMDSGISKDKIKIFGFPVDLEFTKPINKKNVLKKLGLNPKLFTVLLFANVGNNKRNLQIIEETIKDKRDYNVICVTGRNHQLLPKIKHFDKKRNVKILGWTDEAPTLMKTSDLIITKAGGATVMECIAAKKPMIITQIIPGQEEGNAELINNHNLGVILPKRKKGVETIRPTISEIRKNYSKYQKALEKQSRPKAALKIAEFIGSYLF